MDAPVDSQVVPSYVLLEVPVSVSTRGPVPYPKRARDEEAGAEVTVPSPLIDGVLGGPRGIFLRTLATPPSEHAKLVPPIPHAAEASDDPFAAARVPSASAGSEAQRVNDLLLRVVRRVRVTKNSSGGDVRRVLTTNCFVAGHVVTRTAFHQPSSFVATAGYDLKAPSVFQTSGDEVTVLPPRTRISAVLGGGCRLPGFVAQGANRAATATLILRVLTRNDPLDPPYKELSSSWATVKAEYAAAKYTAPIVKAVAAFINDHPVGRWRWDQPSDELRSYFRDVSTFPSTAVLVKVSRFFVYRYRRGPFNRMHIRLGYDVRDASSEPPPWQFQELLIRLKPTAVFRTLFGVDRHRRETAIAAIADGGQALPAAVRTALLGSAVDVRVTLPDLDGVAGAAEALLAGRRASFAATGWFEDAALTRASSRFLGFTVEIARQILQQVGVVVDDIVSVSGTTKDLRAELVPHAPRSAKAIDSDSGSSSSEYATSESEGDGDSQF